jgi:hypothetical protein
MQSDVPRQPFELMPLILLLVAGQRYPVARFHIGQDTATLALIKAWRLIQGAIQTD